MRIVERELISPRPEDNNLIGIGGHARQSARTDLRARDLRGEGYRL